jgi:hypothetical protein
MVIKRIASLGIEPRSPTSTTAEDIREIISTRLVTTVNEMKNEILWSVGTSCFDQEVRGGSTAILQNQSRVGFQLTGFRVRPLKANIF